MDIEALFRNWTNAKAWCPSVKDKIKYFAWIYNRPSLILQKQRLSIRFSFDEPIGHLILRVRCNKGSDAFIFSEIFQHRYYDFRLPMTPDTILDLGANIGFASLFFARKYPSADIACVEPMVENITILRSNIHDNHLSVRIFTKAIATEDGCVSMQCSDNDFGHKISDIAFGKQLAGDTIKVEAISVSSLMSEMRWKRIGLLKIDVEGYEGILLREKCDWLNYVDSICIECHEGFGEDNLRQVARKYGFGLPQRLPGTWLMIRG